MGRVVNIFGARYVSFWGVLSSPLSYGTTCCCKRGRRRGRESEGDVLRLHIYASTMISLFTSEALHVIPHAMFPRCYFSWKPRQAGRNPSLLDLLLLKQIQGTMPEFDPVHLNLLPSPLSSVRPDASFSSAATARRRSAELLPRPQASSTSSSSVRRFTAVGGGVAKAVYPRKASGVASGGGGSLRAVAKGAGGRGETASVPVAPVMVPTLGRPHRVVVIGCGFAGIAAALELQRLGVEVVVVEVREGEREGSKDRSCGVGKNHEGCDAWIYFCMARATQLLVASLSKGLDGAVHDSLVSSFATVSCLAR